MVSSIHVNLIFSKKHMNHITDKGEENGKQRIFSGMQSQDCRLCE